MYSGEQLGDAIKEAIKLKGVKQSEMADYFGVRAPAVSGWIKTGKISRDNTQKLLDYFADVVPPSHFGIDSLVLNQNHTGSGNNIGAQINNHYAPNTPSATAPSSLHTITMPDNSFMPLIPQGSQLWLDEQGDWLDGKIYWIEYADWRGFRRCFRQPENKIDLLADNASFRNFENIDRDKVSILARVVSWKVEDK